MKMKIKMTKESVKDKTFPFPLKMDGKVVGHIHSVDYYLNGIMEVDDNYIMEKMTEKLRGKI